MMFIGSFTGMNQVVRSDFFVPLMMSPRVINDKKTASLDARDVRNLRLKGRLKPGVVQAQAQSELTAIAPVMIGASRKAFIGRITGRDAGPERMAGSLAAVAAAMHAGAALVRVHDVRETVDFLRVMDAIRGGEDAADPAGVDAGAPRSR